MDRPLTRRSGLALGKLIIIGMLVQLAVIVYVGVAAHQARTDLTQAQRRGCERSKLDRRSNAKGWRIAEAARRADGEIAVADKYSKIASGLEERSRINCRKAFP